MKYVRKIAGISIIFFMFLTGCNSDKNIDVVETETSEKIHLREDIIDFILMCTEEETEPPTEPATEPPTEVPTEPPTEPTTVPPTAAPPPTAPPVYAASGIFSEAQVNGLVSDITDAARKAVCKYALLRVGYPYSQAYRNSGKYYDCSSLAYYSCLSAGIDISYYGMNTAAAEAQKLYNEGKSISVNDIRQGDLIFYSSVANGRFMNISHVAIYVGDGMIVEALNQSKGVIYRKLYTNGMVLVCSIL